MSDLVKVRFTLDPTDWHGTASEGLWAEPIEGAAASDVFCLQNSPFFACGVSYLDIVRAVRPPGARDFEFAGALDRSGHSTYMLLVPPDSSDFADYWKQLASHGCTYESATVHVAWGLRNLYSVDVPPSADIYAVCAVLHQGERDSIWRVQEGHVGHALKA